MTELMRRRRALMNKEKTTTPFLLTDGSYANDKIIVTNGNHVVTSGPTTKSYFVPFTRSFPVVSGDLIDIKWAGTSNIKNRRFGFRVNDSVAQYTSTVRPSANTWYNIAVSTDGFVDSFAIDIKEVGLIADMDISIRLNGEVIL